MKTIEMLDKPVAKKPVITHGPASLRDVMTCVPMMRRRKAIEITAPTDSTGFLPLISRVTHTSFLGVVL